ncbi:MAG TPA: pitrilysin family protein [Acidobacteriota bacterium]|nr:pitrilysin family protein [Acidobacteriota bacterium]
MSNNPNIPEFKFEKYRLKNGLDVILLEDHRLPLVAVNLWYHVGPANERPGLTGFAHLFEHMMFEGSKYAGEKAHFLHLEAAGASSINGSTDFDRTNYFETLPSNQLELALWLESDRMGFLLEKLDGERLENQRDVVRNERRQNIENMPYGLVQEELFHQLFPKDHPYHASIIGSHEDIEAARLEDVRSFFQLYYAPNNASLAIVGDIDPARARELVDKYFGPIPQGKPVPRPAVEAPTIVSEKRAIVEDQVELPRVYLAWITDPIFSQGDAECDLIARLLGGGKSSRLYESLVYEKRIAQDAHAQHLSLALGSVFVIDATAKPGVEPQRIEDAIWEELERFRAEGPTPAELERARNTIESAVIRALENIGGFADRLNMYNHFRGDPGYLARDLERYQRASIETLRETAQKKFQRRCGVVVWGTPGSKMVCDVPKSSQASGSAVIETPQIPGQDWRTNPPSPGPVPEMNLPVPTAFKLDNGLSVFLVEEHSLPVLTANIIALSGSDRNPPDTPGLASFVAEMMDEGTGRRSALQIAADADQIGASLSTGSSMDYSYLAIRTLKKNAETALELASDILLDPAFAAEEIERIRNDRLTQILQQKDSPSVLAIKVFFDAVYGSAHPYGYTDIGTEESNGVITQEMLRTFYREGYCPGNSALVVAGDITETELRTLAGKHFGSWKATGSDNCAPAVSGNTMRRVVIVDKPEAPQTVLRIGHVGVERSHPEYVGIEVMNTAFGGLVSSRINLNLRETHGYTYGASSAFVFRRGAGPFLIGASVRTDVTAPAIVEIFNEVTRMREGILTLAELATAKDSIARSLPSLFETTPDSASSIGQLFVHKLPLDYYHGLPKEIQRISAAGVEHLAWKHMRPEEMIIVAVGDRGKIEPELEKLQLGPIEYRDSAGNPTKL